MSQTLAGEILRILAVQIAAFGAILLAASAGHKLLQWRDSVRVVGRFGGVPPRLAPPALALALLAELGACLLLFLPAPTERAAGAMLAAAIWGVYLTLIVRAVRRGRRDVECGCSFGSARHPLGWYEIIRNASLLCAALCVAAVSSAYGTLPLQGSQLLAAGALLALYGALDLVMGLPPLRGGAIA